MEVFVTKKLSEFLQPNKDNSYQELDYKWSASLFYLNRKKCLLFTHKLTLYSFVVLDVKKKDLKTLAIRIINELKAQLNADKINLETALNYFGIETPEEIFFLRTDNDQKTLGWVRDLTQNIKSYLLYNDGDKIFGTTYFANKRINKIPVGSRKFQNSNEMLSDKLSQKES